MKTGLVMEGGAMKGMFTAGVLDVFMEEGITFDGAIGVSAGATFGINIKSKQIGRALRYNKRFCKDKRYASIRNLIFTGDLYGADFCYNKIPWELDPWDVETYVKNPMKFYIVTTEVETGKPVYHLCPFGDDRDMDWIRASASVPLLSRMVELNGKHYLDGGIGDPIPLKYFESQGYDRLVVITTKPRDFVRPEETTLIRGAKLRYGKYPAFVQAVITHQERYNATFDYLKEREKDEDIVVIYPQEKLLISGTERNPDMFDYTYELGRREGLANLAKVRDLLKA